MFVVSQNPSHVFERMELALLDHTRPLKFRPPTEIKLMCCIKFLALIVLRATLVRLEGVSQRGKRDTFEMQKYVKVVQILQLTLGVIITPLTSIMPE